MGPSSAVSAGSVAIGEYPVSEGVSVSAPAVTSAGSVAAAKAVTSEGTAVWLSPCSFSHAVSDEKIRIEASITENIFLIFIADDLL